jgi:hypothetical protein
MPTRYGLTPDSGIWKSLNGNININININRESVIVYGIGVGMCWLKVRKFSHCPLSQTRLLHKHSIILIDLAVVKLTK